MGVIGTSKKDRCGVIDRIEIVHTDGLTGKVTRHTYPPEGKKGWLFRLLCKLHLKSHAVMTNYGTGGIYDLVSFVTGIASPSTYLYIGIGTGTTAATASDTQMSGSSTYSKSVTPTRANSTGSLGDEAVWTHVFSQANDSSLTDTWAVDEVAIQNAASNAAGHMLTHIAGSSQYGAADNCIWGNGDTLSITIESGEIPIR